MTVMAQQLAIFAFVCISLFVWGLLAKESSPDEGQKAST
jgi:hypothetical protein